MIIKGLTISDRNVFESILRWDKYIYVNNEKCHVLDDYYFCNVAENDGENKKHTEQRYLQLKNLFDKY